MAISIIIPHYPIEPSLDEKLQRCLDSLSGYDELILVLNDGIGFAKAVNRGLKYAKGDYLIVVSNDVYLTEGSLEELCNAEAVTSPILNNRGQEFWGAMFCLPRWVYEKIGGLDEQFEIGYYEDDDYIMRLREADIPMKSVAEVKAVTEGAQTMKHFDQTSIYNENRQKFINKWGVGSANIFSP